MKAKGFFHLAGACCLLAGAHSVFACSAEPYLSAMCLTAWPYGGSGGKIANAWVPANGAQLPVTQNAALYSLIGTTYGGNNVSFNLPDLRGRMLIGVGTANGQQLVPGQKVGADAVSLTAAMLPAHAHALSDVPLMVAPASNVGTASVTGLQVRTDLSGLSLTATLAAQAFTGNAGGLTLNAGSGGTYSRNPAGASLGDHVAIYSAVAPATAMAGGSVGGTPSGNLSGTAQAALAGGPSVSVQGAVGAQLTPQGGTFSVTGTTGSTGAAAPLPTMPPYVGMYYYIAINGIYPQQ